MVSGVGFEPTPPCCLCVQWLFAVNTTWWQKWLLIRRTFVFLVCFRCGGVRWRLSQWSNQNSSIFLGQRAGPQWFQRFQRYRIAKINFALPLPLKTRQIPKIKLLEISEDFSSTLPTCQKNWLLKNMPNFTNMPKQKYFCQPPPKFGIKTCQLATLRQSTHPSRFRWKNDFYLAATWVVKDLTCQTYLVLTEQQRWARISTGSDWSQFWPDQDWIGLQFFSKLADQGWIRLRKFLLFQCDYSENIKNFSCDPISQVC